MKTRIVIAAAGAATAALVAGGGLYSASSAASGAPARTWPHISAASTGGISSNITGAVTMTLLAHTQHSKTVTIGGHFGPGSFFIFEESLRDADSGTVVGTDAIRCTAGFTTVTCEGTALLTGKGNITIYGATHETGPQLYAVTGGTGAYRNARGQVQVQNAPHNETKITVQLLP